MLTLKAPCFQGFRTNQQAEGLAQQSLLAQGLERPLAGQVGAGQAAGLDLGHEGDGFTAMGGFVVDGDELGQQGGGGPIAGAVDAGRLGVTQALEQHVVVGAAGHGHGGESTGPVGFYGVVVLAQGCDCRGDDGVQLFALDDLGEAVLVLVAGLLPELVAGEGLADDAGACHIGRLDAHTEVVAGEHAHGNEAESAGRDHDVVVGAFGAGDVELGLEHDLPFQGKLRRLLFGSAA
ncbi:hypothetical protein BH11CYA1_BH11CYA1_06890 [soil metagenome]